MTAYPGDTAQDDTLVQKDMRKKTAASGMAVPILKKVQTSTITDRRYSISLSRNFERENELCGSLMSCTTRPLMTLSFLSSNNDVLREAVTACNDTKGILKLGTSAMARATRLYLEAHDLLHGPTFVTNRDGVLDL